MAEETHLRRLPAPAGPQRRMCWLTWMVDSTDTEGGGAASAEDIFNLKQTVLSWCRGMHQIWWIQMCAGSKVHESGDIVAVSSSSYYRVRNGVFFFSLSFCLCSIAVTVTALPPARLCRIRGLFSKTHLLSQCLVAWSPAAGISRISAHHPSYNPRRASAIHR